MTARLDAQFDLAVVDASQNPIEGDDAHVAVKLGDAPLAGVNATYLGPAQPGRYSVVLPLTKAGDNVLTVLVNEQPIADAVRHVTVVAAAASNRTTTASGGGLAGGDTDDVLSVVVALHDAFDNALAASAAHNVTAAMRHQSAPESGSTRVTNRGDGTFLVEFWSSASGAWLLDVLLDGSPIAGSPFAVTLAWRMSTLSLVAIAGSAGAFRVCVCVCVCVCVRCLVFVFAARQPRLFGVSRCVWRVRAAVRRASCQRRPTKRPSIFTFCPPARSSAAQSMTARTHARTRRVQIVVPDIKLPDGSDITLEVS